MEDLTSAENTHGDIHCALEFIKVTLHILNSRLECVGLSRDNSVKLGVMREALSAAQDLITSSEKLGVSDWPYLIYQLTKYTDQVFEFLDMPNVYACHIDPSSPDGSGQSNIVFQYGVTKEAILRDGKKLIEDDIFKKLVQSSTTIFNPVKESI